MRHFPAFAAQDVRLEGRGCQEAAADITLSSAGEHPPPLLGSDRPSTKLTFTWLVSPVCRLGGGDGSSR